jgi:hypothetical protein
MAFINIEPIRPLKVDSTKVVPELLARDSRGSGIAHTPIEAEERYEQTLKSDKIAA